MRVAGRLPAPARLAASAQLERRRAHLRIRANRGKTPSMPRWIERRGFTLRVPAGARASRGEESEHFVRLSLMERVGLVAGWFNIREARAEPSGQGEQLRVVGGGRTLSWRWLRAPEAERLLDQRLETLRAMGYELIDTESSARGRWDWLYGLIHRRLAKPPEPETQLPPPSPTDALRNTLGRAGLSPDAVTESLAGVLGLSPHEFADPTPATVRKTSPEQLEILLPFLLGHTRAELRNLGERWLLCPPVLYQLPPNIVMTWLETDEKIARLTAPRLGPEGLALLGPEALMRLAHTGCESSRSKARHWANRLSA